MKLTIWTEAYRPFIMGGDVNAPIATEVEVDEPVDVGHGIQVYEITSPSGQTHIAEATTGAFVGTSLKQVKADVLMGDPKVMKKQIKDAMERFKRADHLSPEKFWSMFRER